MVWKSYLTTNAQARKWTGQLNLKKKKKNSAGRGPEANIF